ncbi:hypothetical protein [Oleispirillum naphthae]|uniref:hypothetical protein n=1 Tax=Oleispirillum naphthae TaxID=2838853 RepID=UPI0030826078
MRHEAIGVVVACCGLAGCAGYGFHETPREGGLTYWETAPFLVVATEADCKQTLTVMSMPARPRSVSLNSGYGSAELNIAFKDGTITQIGQKTDTKIPETLTQIAGLTTAYAKLKEVTLTKSAAPAQRAATCPVSTAVYAIDASSGTLTFTQVLQTAPVAVTR